MNQPLPQKSFALRRLALPMLIAAAVIAMFWCRVEWMNGTAYLRFKWRWIESWRIYPTMLAAAGPTLAAQWVRQRWAALGLCAASLLSLQLIAAGLSDEPWSVRPIASIVQSSIATSYFTDAQRFSVIQPLSRMLEKFPALSFYCTLHAREKPPGQILYYMAWRGTCGPGRDELAALLGGIGVAVMATAGVFTTYLLSRALGLSVGAGRAAASCFSLLPGMIAYCPSFDQLYAVFTGLILASWVLALRRKGWRRYTAAMMCGIATAVGSFLAYTILTLGAFCAAAGLLWLVRGKVSPLRLALLVAVVLLPMAAGYGALYAWSGFDPFAMFRHALANQQGNVATVVLAQHYPQTLPSDLVDFLHSGGWVILPPLIVGLWRRRSVIWLAAAEIGVVWVSGLMKAETSRTWLYLQPLALLPVASELGRWKHWERAAFLLLLAFVGVAGTQTLTHWVY